MVTRHNRGLVPCGSTTSLIFNVTFYTLIHIWLQIINTLNNLSYMYINFDNWLIEINNVLQK